MTDAVTLWDANFPNAQPLGTVDNPLRTADSGTVGGAGSLGASENHIGAVGGGIARVSATFTRPGDTTPYTAGDIVSNSTSATTLIALAGIARVNGGSGYLVGIRLSTNLKSITPRFRIRIFNASNPTLSGDNAAFQSKYTDESKRVARFDLAAMITPIDTTNSDMSSTEDDTIRIPFVCAGGSTTLYIALETLDAFTPANGESFTLTLKADQN